MEKVNVTRQPNITTSKLNHDPVVPFWVSEERLAELEECTVVEIEVHGVQVLLYVTGKGKGKGKVDVCAKAKTTPMVTQALLGE